MDVLLVDESLRTLNLAKVQELLKKFNMSYHLLFGRTTDPVEINEAERLRKDNEYDSMIILTKSAIAGEGVYSKNVNLLGITNEISGKTSVIRYVHNWELVMFHELFHQKGLNHCHSKNCLMSVRFEKGSFSYAILSKDFDENSLLCDECYGKIK